MFPFCVRQFFGIPWISAALLTVCFAVFPACAAEPVREQDVKAVFIYNFAKFVEWPDSGPAPVRLCLFGASPFGRAFDALRGQPIKERSFDVIGIDSPNAATGCHMIYVPLTQERSLDKVLARARGNGILVVTDSEGMIARGSMINLYVEDEKVRFEINLHSVEASGLKISSKLLTLSKPPNR